VRRIDRCLTSQFDRTCLFRRKSSAPSQDTSLRHSSIRSITSFTKRRCRCSMRRCSWTMLNDSRTIGQEEVWKRKDSGTHGRSRLYGPQRGIAQSPLTDRFLCQRDGEEEMFSKPKETFPQLIAEITISGPTNEIHLHIHQPVTTPSLFAIVLRTPIHHQPLSHIQCGVQTREGHLPYPRGGPKRYPTKQCAEMEEEPLLRTPKTIRFLQFGESGGLMAEEKQSARPWTTDVLMHGTCLQTPLLLNQYDMTAYTEEECEAIDWEEGPIPLRSNLPGPPPAGWNLFAASTGTVVELLGLAERGLTPDAVFDLESGLVNELEERDPTSACRHRLQYRQWHLELYMDMFCFSGFFLNVCSKRLR
jgi:hypothetical protein